jgi:hypothetical protein
MATLPAALGILLTVQLAGSSVVDIAVDPAMIRLEGDSARRLLLVEGTTSDGGSIDLTRSVTLRPLDRSIARVDQHGAVRAVGDGETTVVVEWSGFSREVVVRVEGTGRSRRFNFENDIIPVLSKLG